MIITIATAKPTKPIIVPIIDFFNPACASSLYFSDFLPNNPKMIPGIPNTNPNTTHV